MARKTRPSRGGGNKESKATAPKSDPKSARGPAASKSEAARKAAPSKDLANKARKPEARKDGEKTRESPILEHAPGKALKPRAPKGVVPPPQDALRAVNPPPGEPEEELKNSLPFTVVGIGASAGGLDATSNLLRQLTPDTGMAIVVVLHLDPTHESMLSQILARTTKMPVLQAENQNAIEPNHIYVIPPGRNMVMGDGMLQLSPRTEQRGQHRPIDLFFRSLAEHQAHRSIGVILSGSSSDGTLGLEEIKAAGGVTFAQDDTAQHTTMPRSAIAAGCIDFVLAPDDIAREIGRISRHPYVSPSADGAALVPNETVIGRVLELLRHNTGVDFRNYKRNTLQRRITRRMLLHKCESLQDYLRYLQSTPGEADALYQDILINVTSFFRDPEAYEVLKAKVFPALTDSKSRHDQVRVWALGCSTGEEAYSIAMAYTEYVEQTGRRVPMQIFATDLNGAGVEKARSGVYSKGIAQDLSAERLRRFFVEVDGSYRIAKPIRDMCIFARQNVLADPPFSRMDLIACRNMLIYLEPVLQQKLLPILHYALQPVGYLWLGSSETIGGYRDLFEIEDAKNKIYSKKSGNVGRVFVRIPHDAATVPHARLPERSANAPATPGPLDPQREADRILLQRYAPPGVLINADLEIQQFRGDTSAYLMPAPGRASLNLLKMLREGLMVGVRGAVHRARRDKTSVRQEKLRVKADGGYREVDVTVIPMAGGVQDGHLLVTFESANGTTRPRSATAAEAAAMNAEAAAAATVASDTEVARLRQELDATREYMQSLVEQQEAANEELQSANEEVQSANEELQSINEELETSKEEIQSSNEELATVNDELQNRNSELSQSNNDLVNLLASVQMPIVMLGRDLRIRRFTPAAEKMLNLIPTDVGRPIGDIKLGLTVADLEELLTEVVDTVSVRERIVQDKNGKWFALRVHPYKTLENKIDGAVIVLVDVDQLKRAESALRESEGRFSQLANSAPVLIWVEGPEGKRYVNRAYLDFLGVAESDVQGMDWSRFVHPDDREGYLAVYRDSIARHEPFEYQFRFRRRDGEYRWMKTVGVPRETSAGYLGHIGFKVDITDLKDAERSLREADRSKNNFLATLAHELRTPLAAMRNAVQVIGHPNGNEALMLRAKSVMERQTAQMVRMVDDLLDLSRLTRGTFRLRLRRVDLLETLRQAIDVTAHEREANEQKLIFDTPGQPVLLEADAARLQQVFANLLGNAARYSAPKSRVWITVERAQLPAEAHPGVTPDGMVTSPWVIVHVRDEGVGIDSEALPHVFDLFTQVDEAPGTGIGLGIGLNLAKRLVELHGGRITVTSPGKDKGSEFIVFLPVEDAADLRRETWSSSDVRDVPSPAQPLRVLVVDDNPDAADMLEQLLLLAKQEVRTANDGPTALQIAREFRPDLILLDIAMPEMDGIAVARRLREDAQTRSAFLVAVTGFSPGDRTVDLSGAGFNERVTKPLENEALLTLIARVQQRSREAK